MNARHEPDERVELARLLPAPADPELPRDRHRLLKDHLMHEITQAPTAAPAAPRRSRRRLPLIMAALAAGTAAVAATVIVQTGVGTSPAPQSYLPVSYVVVQPASTKGVGKLLDRIASAADRTPALTVGPNQYVYVASKIAFTHPLQQRTFDGPVVMDPIHQRQVWLSQNLSRPGLIRENGKDMTLHEAKTDMTYRTLAALPTDPAALLKWIYTYQGDNDPSRAFNNIGTFVGEQIMPPRLGAALYRTAALIKGVSIVPDSVDAVGRHGVAVAMVYNGERTEWIFDKTTLAYLGERSYLVKTTTAGKAGMLTGTSAVLGRGIADKAGTIPDHTG